MAHYKRTVHIQQEYQDEMSNELVQINIKRERILAIILSVFCIILIWLNTFANDSQDLYSYISKNAKFLHYCLLTISIIFLLLTEERNKDLMSDNKIIKGLHLSICNLTLILCSFIAIYNQLADQKPFAFIVAILSISSILLLTVKERMFTFMSAYGFYLLGLVITTHDLKIVIEITFFTSPLIVLALIVSHINYAAYVESFINKKVIQKKNEELDNLYKVTDQNFKRSAEELSKTMEIEKLRINFFANISHELRTPLNVIYSADQMLDYVMKGNEINNNQKQAIHYTSIIRQNCHRLIRLVANLIDITKMDAGYFLVNLGNHNIVKVVEDITLSVAEYVEGKDIHLIFDTEIEEEIIACDPDKIERIMLNLLSNAIKFTPKGGNILVSIRENENSVLICVEDTGIGIPDEMKEVIFDRFIQVDKTVTRDREGSGIGLSIVKSLVELHDGYISLESKIGKGSKFEFAIPKRLVSICEGNDSHEFVGNKGNVEKIKIEFSDIYF